MNNYEFMLDLLNQIEKTFFRYKIKEDDLEKYVQLTFAYENATESERSLIRSVLTKKQGGRLKGFSGVAAERSMNTGEFLWIKVAIICHLIEDFRTDFRENVREIILLNHAASRIGFSIKKCFEEIRSIATVSSSNLLEQYLRDQQPLSTIKSYGMKEVLENGVITFLPNP